MKSIHPLIEQPISALTPTLLDRVNQAITTEVLIRQIKAGVITRPRRSTENLSNSERAALYQLGIGKLSKAELAILIRGVKWKYYGQMLLTPFLAWLQFCKWSFAFVFRVPPIVKARPIVPPAEIHSEPWGKGLRWYARCPITGRIKTYHASHEGELEEAIAWIRCVTGNVIRLQTNAGFSVDATIEERKAAYELGIGQGIGPDRMAAIEHELKQLELNGGVK